MAKKNKNLLFELAKDAKHFFLTSGNKHFKEKAKKHYADYKKQGGKKKLSI